MSVESMIMFVCSYEGSLDSEAYFEKSIESYWPDCPFKIYVGNNADGKSNYAGHFSLIHAPRSNWIGETYQQISRLKELHPGCSHVLLMLDDFVLGESVDTAEVSDVYRLAQEHDLNYIQLTRLECSFIARLFLNIDEYGLLDVPQSHPYYSSLHPAIWKIDHVLKLLQGCDSIWSFEEIKGPYGHKSIAKDLIHYKHIVEKGLWDPSAKDWCMNSLGFFEQGSRRILKLSAKDKMRIALSKISFFIFGYTLARLRRKLRSNT